MARSRRFTFVIPILAFAALLAAPPVSADRGGSFAEPLGAIAPQSVDHEGAHTVTWWCVDLNDLWHVDVPVTAGPGVLTPPANPPFPPCTSSTFPVRVPAGSGWTGAGNALWFTHTHYTPQMQAALEAAGYPFVSASPMEDLFQKIVEIVYVVRRLPENAIVAEHSFDPRQTFRLVRFSQFNGERPTGPIEFPELGISLSADAVGRLPSAHFPGIGEPLPPGLYRVHVFWILSAPHNDGLGMANPGNVLGTGANQIGAAQFLVVP